jgi:hypothetical protein
MPPAAGYTSLNLKQVYACKGNAVNRDPGGYFAGIENKKNIRIGEKRFFNSFFFYFYSSNATKMFFSIHNNWWWHFDTQ